LLVNYFEIFWVRKLRQLLVVTVITIQLQNDMYAYIWLVGCV